MKVNIWTNVWTKIRRFGLDYDDFQIMMDNVAFLLKILTIDIHQSTPRAHFIIYIIVSLAVLIYIYVYTFSMVWMVFFRYGKKDLKATFLAIAISFISDICITRLAFMKYYSEDIKNTVSKFLECYSKIEANTRFAKNLRMKLRIVKRRALYIWVFLMFDTIIYLVLPIVTPGRHFSIETYLIYGLEPMTETPNYQIATMFFTITTSFGVYTMVCIGVYVIVIVGYNEAQLRALSIELRNIWDDGRNFYHNVKHRIKDKRYAVFMKGKIINEFIRIRLMYVVKFHVANINLQRDIEQEFRPIFAVEYTIMAFAIIAELLGGLENTYLVVPFTSVLILMDCLSGQRLIDACDDFERSIYFCQWENFNTSNQKTVQLMLMMSQKTLMLSAGGVNQLNYNCLMVILKSTYSTYTTLKSTVKKHAEI
ncbi:uncharacterized protein LOC123660569 [Melitaea cinxia]|uniref:uncharacterized protein LOC123660569 n=1 Tax=Melitaea cinxia TaxID=113334 RepID=UPI001E26F63C|nr:uncharacterized protein LOC123660569 [Melitaea cinxia]